MRTVVLHIAAMPQVVTESTNGSRSAGVQIRTWCGVFHDRINVAMYAPRVSALPRQFEKLDIELVDPISVFTGEQPIERPFCEKCKPGHVSYKLTVQSKQPEEEIPF